MSDLDVAPSVRRRIVIAVVGLVGALLVVIAALVLIDRDSGGADGPLEPMRGPDPGMGSAFALAIGHNDGAIYVGARFGLFTITGSGEASRAANRHQETHALAVLGPGHLLASGHPDPREDRPSKLGLIESVDGGRTWETLSLSGDADFHVLRARHGRVYGYDAAAQRFMVSHDRREWDFRATLSLTDFVVSPNEADLVLGVSNGALVRSVDGGQTFTPADGAPGLARLAWAGSGRLYAVTGDGRVLLSADGGGTWAQRGQVDGVPQALVADGDTDVYVATDTGVYDSHDGAQTFSLYYRER